MNNRQSWLGCLPKAICHGLYGLHITSDDLQEYLADASDFGFELRTLNQLHTARLTCQHGGLYEDPVTGAAASASRLSSGQVKGGAQERSGDCGSYGVTAEGRHHVPGSGAKC
jgi:hypothetical protein